MLEGPPLIRGGSLFCGGWGGEGGRGEFPPPTHRKRGIFPSSAVGGRGEKCKKADRHRYHQFEWKIAPRPCFVNKTILETISHVE